jgi:hypothetical protein
MMMTRHEADGAPQDGDELDDLFALARGQQAEPSGALMARVLAGAQAAQPRSAAPRILPASPAVAPRGSAARGWRAVWQALGGWPAMGGLTAATVTGFWLGLAPPAALGSWASLALGLTETVSIATEGDLYGLTGG